MWDLAVCLSLLWIFLFGFVALFTLQKKKAITIDQSVGNFKLSTDTVGQLKLVDNIVWLVDNSYQPIFYN